MEPQQLDRLMQKVDGDPIKLSQFLWPKVRLYDKQIEIVYSVRDNDETVVPAGNMLGKDFIAGLIAVGAFLFPQVFLGKTRKNRGRHEVRAVTTSVKDDHLDVLWGEIGRFVQTCAVPLSSEFGGPLILRHREIRKIVKGQECEISYLKGQVSKKGEGMAGHHAPSTLCIIDEASGVDEIAYQQALGWEPKLLIIGNPNPCENFFRKGVNEGDLVAY